MDQPIRLAGLTAAVALAADAGAALAPETSLRTCLLAIALARASDLPDQELRDVYYASLLRHIGCTASAHEETRLVGDEVELRTALGTVDFGKPGAVLPALVRGLARGKGPISKARAVASFLTKGATAAPAAFLGRCEVAVRFAVRLGLGAGVERALDQAYERWDGKGLPRRLQGESVCRVARVVAIAELASLFVQAGGAGAAAAVVEERAGGQVDPELSATLRAKSDEIFATIDAASLWDRALEAEPRPWAMVSASKVGIVCELLADYADMKSPFTAGHSRGVAEVAAAAAERLELPRESVAELRLAALVHDLGRVAVSNAIWDKPGALDEGERAHVRAHTYETDRILSRSAQLARLACIASLAHERLDGKGYHRGLSGAGIETSARLLAAADVAQALSQPRAHRQAFAPDAAAAELEAMAKRGALCTRAVDAVLVAIGAKHSRARAAYPKGLSEREVEVLRLVARGLTDKEIAQQLSISHRTVHAHNQHAFTKIGVATRAAAALFLVENDLLGS